MANIDRVYLRGLIPIQITIRNDINLLTDAQINRALRRTARRMAPDIRQLAKEHMERSIMRNTTQRTGTLLRSVTIKTRVLKTTPGLTILPEFRRTSFGSGQYAFVVDSRNPARPGYVAGPKSSLRDHSFIRKAWDTFHRDSRKNRIILKHMIPELRRAIYGTQT